MEGTAENDAFLLNAGVLKVYHPPKERNPWVNQNGGVFQLDPHDHQALKRLRFECISSAKGKKSMGEPKRWRFLVRLARSSSSARNTTPFML